MGRIRDKRLLNTLISTAKAQQEHLGDTAHGVKPIIPYIEAYILPASTVQTGYVVSPTGIPHTFPDHSLQAQLRPIFNVAAPSSADDLVMIVTRPVQGGTDFVGRAVVQGLAVVNVEVTDADHEFAVPVASDMTKLVSAATGPVRIIKPRTVGTAERMCMVGVKPEAGAAATSELLAPTSTTGLTSSFLTLNNGSMTLDPGTYILIAHLTGLARVSSADLGGSSAHTVYARFYDNTLGVALDPTHIVVVNAPTINTDYISSATLVSFKQFTQETTLQIQGRRDPGSVNPATWVSAALAITSSGATPINLVSAIKIA